ncbi:MULTISPECIES: response regulator transcription factor [Achromobacter]|jgi:DNA-binding response OmpR family regulator|uniref:Response regulator transcription factor n=1 Tax=Achromobacter aegrifaciens TaxID=1287736 RepID=A0ABU2DF64_ACHAE|nr:MULTISPECIES: response regulator transcription factor [Achromobacter]PTN50069.1 DNA-binding response regulator [Achromobacter xylosoxidans]MBD9382467.1 response regulator transcription factor [Achromobacter sp. ACM02]MBD9420435.1 response regulator transcription factor [Achromobacter sp. ACM04]MBD9430690.1 response regulator transcription factor [Achromobacter sp. ACM03]MBD9472256.1 response regulator transcription factor [Achromobacter sp. ACM01]
MATSPAAGANYRVLIVEDDPVISGNLYTFLEARGFLPDAAYSGPAALERLKEQRFDALILDIGLPGMDGNAVLHTLRNDMRADVPVLMLTARDSLEDKLAGFSHGADDYLTKPFALLEVEARLVALIQRAKGATVDSVRAFGPLSYDTRNRAVSVNGSPVHLTRKASLIIEALLRDPGRVVSREELESTLWGNEPPSSDALRSQVHLLRRALADAGFDGIETIHGTGWRLTLEAGATR